MLELKRAMFPFFRKGIDSAFLLVFVILTLSELASSYEASESTELPSVSRETTLPHVNNESMCCVR